MMNVHYSNRKKIKSAAVMMYFIMLVLHNLYQSAMIEYIWYLVLMVCFCFGIVKKTIRIKKWPLLLLVFFTLSALANMILVGNSTLVGIGFVFIYIGVYELLAEEGLDDRYILIAIYVNCAIISLNIVRHGLGNAVMGELSNNFVSVLLLIPTIVYYTRLEKERKRIPVLPALAVTVSSFLAVGRSGIITSAMLLLFILWYITISDKNWKNAYNQTLFRIVIVIAGIAVVFVLISFIGRLQSLPIFQKFTRYGMYGTGRAGMWEEYLETMRPSLKSVVFGVNYKYLPLMVRYKNNLHNSFFNLHADYGLFVLLFVIYLFLLNCRECLKKKQWIYLSMMIVFFVRAFTDRIFGGGSSATPVLFFILLYIHEQDSIVFSAKQFKAIGRG